MRVSAGTKAARGRPAGAKPAGSKLAGAKPVAGGKGKARSKPAVAKPKGKPKPAARTAGGITRQPDAGRMQAETTELIAAIGARLRDLRQRQGLTLHALSARTGLSSSMLSLLERGRTGPSIGTLVVIASALGTPMAELLDPRAARAEEDPVSRRAAQPVFATADGVRRRILASDTLRGVEIAVNEYSPGTASAPDPVSHDGYEFGIALEGGLEVTLNGRVHRLQEGDLVAYRSTDPHRIANPGRSQARALWINLKRG